ncbi:MAG: glycoside hydrolase family 32 protein [Chloroflexi bacterium]|nr:glycoside hydrolase family 32 protein [Chloroflexota bacterium]
MTTTNHDFAKQRRNLAQDFHRPIYHFIGPASWMNDPNGVIQWGGKYHLFYQYHPESPRFGLAYWGHAVSEDAIHWVDLPVALSPTPGGPDATGCWSGCVADNDGLPTAVYTGVGPKGYGQQSQCIATSQDDLLSWEKYSGNPILSEIPAIANQSTDLRDPMIWREGDTWYMLLASRIKPVGGSVFLYRSADLIRWEFLHPLLTGSYAKDGCVWECPSFFPLGDKWVLIVAGKGRKIPFTVFYFIGDYVDQEFRPETSGILDHAYFYAPFTMEDAQGRRLLWGWLREGRSEEAHVAAGWAGCHSIPRELSLRNGQLHMVPVPELEQLRDSPTVINDIRLTGGDHMLEIGGAYLDIEVEFDAEGTVGLAVACASDGGEETRVSYNPDNQLLSVNRERSGLDQENETFSNEAPHELAPGESLQLRILLDGSVLEIIANGRTSICSRIYPSRADSQGLRLFGRGQVRTLSVWQMRSIWPQ